MTVQKKRTIAVTVFFIALLLIFLILHLDRVNTWLGEVCFVLRPVIIGLVLAYFCNPLFRLFERKLFANVRHHGFRRFLSLLLTYIVVFLILFTLIMLIVPQLIESVLDFLTNYESYITSTVKAVNEIIDVFNKTFSASITHLNAVWIQTSIGNFFANLKIESFLESLLTYSNISTLFNTLTSLFSLVTDIIFGIFISLYILNSKEKQYAQLTRWRRAIFSPQFNDQLTRICTIADRSFGGFLRGKLLDSTMVGVLVFILISILKIPYPLLIAIIIGITDIVPVIGPFVGVIPSAIIILLTDPIKVIPFLICILIVQQIDGNIIAPKILGENTGVSSLCVMIAITILGSLWGLVGMVIAVPLSATVLELVSRFLEKRLHEKGFPVSTHQYYDVKESARENDTKSNHKKEHDRKKKARPSLHVGGHGDLTDEERLRLRAYTLAIKHGVLHDRTEESFRAFSEAYTANTEKAVDAEAIQSTEI